VINTSDNIAPLAGHLLPYRRPEPIDQPVKARDALQKADVRAPLQTEPKANTVAAPNDEWRAEVERKDLSGLGVRERHALEAYSSLQDAGRREFVRQVMGIDEFV
jgi:hypothetical protein